MNYKSILTLYILLADNFLFFSFLLLTYFEYINFITEKIYNNISQSNLIISS